jgi:hypothetical protein
MIALCQRKACEGAAVGALTISIPYPVQKEGEEPQDPVTFFVGAEVCQDHLDAFDAKDFLSPGLRMQIARCLVASGAGRPDFDRAWANAVPVNDQQWLQFKAGIAASSAGPEH